MRSHDTLDLVLPRIEAYPERLAAILDEYADPLLAFSSTRVILAANVSAGRFFGYGPQELDGHSADDLLPERLRQAAGAPAPRAPAATQDRRSVEVPGLRRDGSELVMVWTYGAASSPSGPIFVAVVRDRAQLTAEVESLRRSDARYRSLLLASASGVWVTNAEGELVEPQPAWEAYTGQCWEEYRGSGWIAAIHPDDRGRVMEDWTTAVRTGPNPYCTYGRIWSVRHDTWRATQTRAVPVRSATGEILEWIGALTDVQDTLDAHERLRESEDRYWVLFEKSPFPLALTRTPHCPIVAVNRAFLELFEFTREEALGQTAVSLGITDAGERVVVEDELRLRGHVSNLECVRRTKSGRRIHVCLNLSPVQIGGRDHLLATVQDISLRKEQEAALERIMADEKRARSEAEAANRAKDEFLATMSHELRTPLNAILGWASILRMGPHDSAKLERGVQVIERNAKTQERIVGDLLDTSRIISGKLALTLARTALADVVSAATDVVRPAAESKGVRLVVDVASDLPELVADTARLQQVVWNLLINAVRHTPPGGCITVSGQRSASGLCLRVRDTGAGIAPEHLTRIFERFRQVDSSSTRGHGGLGLGLAIVRHLVEAHGGEVEAHSEGAGCGATFTVHLPVRAVDVSGAAARAEAGATPPLPEAGEPGRLGPGADLGGVSVLVVEDDRDSLEMVRVVLEGAGARVTPVANAPDALDAVQGGGPFDIIVSDICMPEMDGYAMLRRLRAREPGREALVPAIALTAYVTADDAARARRAGFQEHLAKPIEAAKLIDVVRRWGRARPPVRMRSQRGAP
jgi:PAS domain S-box-containing protein